MKLKRFYTSSTMNIEQLELLKRKVEKRIGRVILTSSDCLMLSNDIYLKTEVKISVNTLRRLFNLIKSEYQPSLFTLDLLSRYCNYKSYSDFITPGHEFNGNAYSPREVKLISVIADLVRRIEPFFGSEVEFKRILNEVENEVSEYPDITQLLNSRLNIKQESRSRNYADVSLQGIIAKRNDCVFDLNNSDFSMHR